MSNEETQYKNKKESHHPETEWERSAREAAEVVRRGGLILYPTDTVWGIGCDASNAEAVARVFALKRRADHKALIVMVADAAELDRYVDEVSEIALELLEVADRPTTIVYDGARGLAPALVGEDGTVGIRVTGEAFSRSLCRRCRRPLVSTSANISGQPAPGCFAEIPQEILDGVDYVATVRRDEPAGSSRPSAVIRLRPNGEVKILRQ